MAVYSTGVRLAWQIAGMEAGQSGHERIEPVHLLIGVCSLDKFLAPEVLPRLKLSDEQTQAAKQECDVANALLRQSGGEPVSLRRQLRAGIKQGPRPDGAPGKISRSDTSRLVFGQAEAQSSGSVLLTHLLAALGVALRELLVPLGVSIPQPEQRATPLLDDYGRDLTALAKDGKLNPCIGRRGELLEVVRTLSRATKNNPLLIGDPGVGKTAIVEGLAWRIAQGKSLPGTRIIQLQIADLVSGTKHRGEFEQRLTDLIEEAARLTNTVLFIDEIHGLIGAGDSGGNMDAANILKPALARGEIRCIGATTTAEFRKYIEKDPALERRFLPITIEEPTIDEAIAILQAGYVNRFAARHGVLIEEDAVGAAVKLSAKYLPDRRLPDKAIDLLDAACALVAVPLLSAMPEETKTAGLAAVTAGTVAEILAQWTGIPAGRMNDGDRERLRGMGYELKRRIIGQDHACERVAQLVHRARAGLKAANRPIGVLFFSGPTGTGKTELAKATAEFLFGSEEAMIRIDMSEFMEKHAVSRLIGSPPGYIGHDEEGQLTGALRRTPYAVVLLDEVEKAHPDVLNLFLQIFDDGRVTDSKGRAIDATNAMFILTSNVSGALGRNAMGFLPAEVEKASAAAREEIGKVFRPELLNRFDDIVVFSALSMESSARIVRLMLRGLAKRLAEQQMQLRVDDGAVLWLTQEGYDPAFGARPLRRVIERCVENPIAERILAGLFHPGETILMEHNSQGLTFSSQKGA